MDSHVKGFFGKLMECPEIDLTGESENPIHRELGIKVIVAQLAHAVSTKEQVSAALRGQFSNISFTAKQERDFVQLQILLNLHLNSLRLSRLPLLHLSPRMLLPHKLSSKTEHTPSDCIPEAETELDSTGTKKKAKRKKKKAVPTSDSSTHSANTTVESAAESVVDPDDDMPVLEPCIDEESLSETDDAAVFLLPSATEPFRFPGSRAFPQGLPSGNSDTTTAQRNALTHAALLKADALSQQAPAKPYTYSIPRAAYRTAECALGPSAMENVDRVCDAYEQVLMNQREQHGSIQQSLSLRLFIAQSELDALKEKMGLAAALT
eukprot:CAMPEP_0184973264 /NCGR_PEP_ID=MMETSP1098-20130426/5130_1 /TAXON_ID=89044 /ORGANISM="Spumella elongata, Strain CCAP 955/1" /LENGTH=321 /DNA_ID=CAMNT_0027495711 /DNA_START=68 /DNA_END=1033 /DNA_ORIENTATION=+